MSIVFRPLGSETNISAAARGQIFPVQILDAAEGTATVSVNSETLKVKTEVPLSRHQILLVQEEKSGDGGITWRILKDLSVKDTSGKIGLSTGDEIIRALRWLGAPLTENNLARAGHFLELLGKPTAANVLAAAISAKAGVGSADLIQAIAAFVSSLLFGSQMKGRLNDKNQISSYLRQCCEGLQRVLQFIREHPQCSLAEALHKCFPGNEELGRQLIGGQFFARLQELVTGGVFYYLPLFLQFPIEVEAYLSPSQQGGKKQLLVVLLLETESLGRVRMDLIWGVKRDVLEARAVVERQETKELFENCWPELAARLKKGGLQMQWAGCRVESLSLDAPLMKKAPRSFDLLI